MKDMFAQGGAGSAGIKTNKQALARTYNVKVGEVIYSNDTTSTLDGKKIVYDKPNQYAWKLPSGIPAGAVIVSVVGSTLTYNPGSIAVELLAAASAQSGISAVYPDVAAAQAAINAGTETRKYIYIRDITNGMLAQEYRVDGTTLVAMGRGVVSNVYVTDALNEIHETIQEVPSGIVGNGKAYLAVVSTGNGKMAPFMNTEGRLVFLDAAGKEHLVASDDDIITVPYMESAPFILPDGAICNKLVLTADGTKIVEAWTEDGGYYFATSDGLTRSDGNQNSGNTQGVQNYASGLGGAAGLSTTRLSAVDDDRICYLIITWGQSLAQGWNTGGASDQLVANTILYPNNAFMFKSSRGAGKENPNRDAPPNTEYEPLKETINGNWVETAASSVANHVIAEVERITSKRIRTFSYVVGSGGQPFHNLTQGTATWNALIQGMVDFRTICQRNNWIPVVLGVDVMAGESDTDQVSNMSTERYKRQLMQLDRTINREVKRIFNQNEPVCLYLNQGGFTPGAPTYSNIWSQSRVRQAQFEMDGIGNIRLCSTNYWLPYGDVIHINSMGQNRRGQAIARGMILEKFGCGTRPIKPLYWVWADDTTLQGVFDVPMPPLVIDKSDTYVKTAGLGDGYGFIFDDRSGDSPVITEVSTDNTSVTIKLNKPPRNRSGCRIGYAVKRNDGNSTQDGQVVGARGCLRDSSAFASLYEINTSHANWCPAFYFEIK